MSRDDDPEREAIIALIEAETLAFFSRDFEGWARCWVHSPGARRLGMLPGGHLDYHESWDASSAVVARIMADFPEANPEAALGMRRENLNIRIGADMAWVSFDQYGPDTGDMFDAIGLSHQIRVLEKHSGEWKIAFAGDGETSVGYFGFPAIRVDKAGAILWMNEAARQRLPDHPALLDSGGLLRAQKRNDTKRLLAALEEVANLTPMDIRRSVLPKALRHSTVPLVLGDDDSDVSHLCWVSTQDRMLVVSFNDSESEAERLSIAERLYGLSPGQARLAALIVDGKDLPQAAVELGISINTARTQLQRMFEKTGVRSQVTLVRSLLSAGSPGR